MLTKMTKLNGEDKGEICARIQTTEHSVPTTQDVIGSMKIPSTVAFTQLKALILWRCAAIVLV